MRVDSKIIFYLLSDGCKHMFNWEYYKVETQNNGPRRYHATAKTMHPVLYQPAESYPQHYLISIL